jgi:hypothetical protein
LLSILQKAKTITVEAISKIGNTTRIKRSREWRVFELGVIYYTMDFAETVPDA